MNNYPNLKCDVLLTADVFGKFRNNSLKNYGLYLSHHLSAPALSCGTILNTSKVELEIFPDSNMFIFSEKGTRGGVYSISKKYSKASNKYLMQMTLNKDQNIIYLDANNPYDDTNESFFQRECDLNKYTKNILERCVLEIDVEYSRTGQLELCSD